MADIELVIKIPEEGYKQIIEEGEVDYLEVITAIENGTPLPKGHGRLIDADALELDAEWVDYYDDYVSYSSLQIDNAPAIIEARYPVPE